MITRLLLVALFSGLLLLLTSAGCTPKNGRVAEPAFSLVAPGSGVIMKPLVLVCYQVLTTGHFLLLIFFQYYFYAFGLIGLLTELRMRSDDWLVLLIALFFFAISARIAVGAVQRILT